MCIRDSAYDIDTGEELWRSRLGTSVEGFPVTFAIDGEQYVAFTSGREGGSPWRIGSFLAPELVSPDGHNALYVFKLNQKLWLLLLFREIKNSI